MIWHNKLPYRLKNGKSAKRSLHTAHECICGLGVQGPTKVSLMCGFLSMCGLQGTQMKWVDMQATPHIGKILFSSHKETDIFTNAGTKETVTVVEVCAVFPYSALLN